MKSKILKMLRNADEFISGQSICDALNISRTAVWKYINQLKTEGYEIEAVSNKGYHIVQYPDIVTKEEIESQLILKESETENIIKKVVFYDEVDSTNNVAKQAAEDGEESGTLFVTEHQTAGRGRRGKTWVSPAGSEICMTLLLRPEINPAAAPMLTIITAMAVAYALNDIVKDISNNNANDMTNHVVGDISKKDVKDISNPIVEDASSNSDKNILNFIVEGTSKNGGKDILNPIVKNISKNGVPVECFIKWPNDIVMGNHKICGILTEMSAEPDWTNYVVIGIGINVNTEQFDDEVNGIATSIYRQTGVKVKRSTIIVHFIKHFSQMYTKFIETCDLSAFIEDYNTLLINCGRQVQINENNCSYTALAQGIDKFGRLIVEKEDGQKTEIMAGEVSVRGLYGYV